MKFESSLGVFALAAVGFVAAQNNLRPISLAIDPTGKYTFCDIFLTRSAVVGTKLYIDGGSITLSLNAANRTKDFVENNNRLLTLDLSTTFAIEDLTLVSRAKPASEPTFNDGIMFSSASGNDLITYGGFYPRWNTSASGNRQPNSSISATRLFSISGGQWSSINGLPGLAEGARVSAPGTGRAWYLGGAQDERTTQGLDGRYAVKGMLEFRGTSVKNLTTPFEGLIGAMMVYIPGVGKEGILVKIGGESYTAGMVSMETVDIYDISSGAWLTQTTTGDPTITGSGANSFPKPRMFACLVAASAPDNSSHHIYMYHGAAGYFTSALDEIWVLSLPMFRWTGIAVGHTSSGFFGDSCHMVGKRYLLSFGGLLEPKRCNYFIWLYDTSELRWVDTYYPNTEYIVPPKIAAIVGGTSQGGATVTSPEAGWGSNVEAVFRSQNTSIPSRSPSPSTLPRSKSNKPAILGGVLGGVLGAAAVLSALLFLLRRRRLHAGTPHHPRPAELPISDPGS